MVVSALLCCVAKAMISTVYTPGTGLTMAGIPKQQSDALRLLFYGNIPPPKYRDYVQMAHAHRAFIVRMRYKIFAY